MKMMSGCMRIVMINQLAHDIHEWAISKGFYDREYIRYVDPVTGDVEGKVRNESLPSEKLLLAVSEICEAQDAMRDGNYVLETEEIADAIIRLLDYCAWRNMDIEKMINDKMSVNENRPHLHGRKVF